MRMSGVPSSSAGQLLLIPAGPAQGLPPLGSPCYLFQAHSDLCVTLMGLWADSQGTFQFKGLDLPPQSDSCSKARGHF